MTGNRDKFLSAQECYCTLEVSNGTHDCCSGCGGMFKFRWLCDLIYFGVRWRVGRQDDHHSPHSEPPQS